MTVTVAHDVTCPWCWIGLHQARRLQAEFGVEIDWVGYELFPEGSPWPESAPPGVPPRPDRPKTPTRLELAYAAEGLEPPRALRPRRMRVGATMQAFEAAEEQGVGDAFLERVYRAYWERGEAVGEVGTLVALAEGLVPDVPRLVAEVETLRYADRVVTFDEGAHARGVYNVPTFFIEDGRYAEQPYGVLARAMRDRLK